MKQFKTEYDKINKLKLAETGEKLTEREAWNVYYYCFLQDLKSGIFEGYNPGELEALKEFREEQFKKLAESPDFQELLKASKQKEEPKKELLPFNKYEQITLTNSYLCNSKIANEIINISKDSLQGNKTALNIARAKRETINIIAYFGDDKNITIEGKPLTAFDKVVHTAVCTLWQNGTNEGKEKNEIVFNLQQVYKTINGITENKAINPEMTEDIKDSLNKLIKNRIFIDCTEQLEKWKAGKKPKKAIVKNYLLPLKEIEIEMQNGEKVNGYQFLDVPPLYAYSNMIGQVISVPIQLLDTSKLISNTKENTIFRERLIQLIAIMKSPKNKRNNLINYENLFKYAEIDTENLTREQLRRKREVIKKILDYFITQKYIKSYEEYKNGQKIAGLKINF